MIRDKTFLGPKEVEEGARDWTLLFPATLTAGNSWSFRAGFRLQGHLFVPTGPAPWWPCLSPCAWQLLYWLIYLRACYVDLSFRGHCRRHVLSRQREAKRGVQMPEPRAGGEPPPGGVDCGFPSS